MQTPVNLPYLIVQRTDVIQSISMQPSKEWSLDLQQPNSVPDTIDAISYTVSFSMYRKSQELNKLSDFITNNYLLKTHHRLLC